MILKQILKQHRFLLKELKEQRSRLAELNAWSVGGSSMISGLPFSTRKTDKTATIASHVVDLENAIQKNIDRCLCDIECIEKTIYDIPDSIDRQILIYRYIKNYSWNKIAITLGFSNESVPRNRCTRLEKKLCDEMEQPKAYS